ncbi:MAG: glycosyltransferase family 4 protein [Mycobacteriales bacterium]
MPEHIVLVLATSTGGTGTHVRTLAGGLVRSGARVTVCGPQSTEDAFGFVGAGADFHAVEIAGGLRPLADARAARTLRPIAADATVVHAHGLRAGLVAGSVTPRSTPFVVTWHNAVLATGPARAVYDLLQRVVARRADITLCVSPDLEDRVRHLGGRDVRPGPVPAPALSPPGRSPAEVRAEFRAADRPLVLTIARLHEQKGYPTLVAAAAQLAGRDPAPLFLAAGDGPQRATIVADIARTGAPVRLLGWRTDLADLLAAADVVVVPSVWEGSPLAAQEALRAGRPLVATAVGGIPKLVGDGVDLVAPGDHVALARAIARVLDDPEHAAALVARGTLAAARLPTEETTLAQVRAIYAELLGREW